MSDSTQLSPAEARNRILDAMRQEVNAALQPKPAASMQAANQAPRCQHVKTNGLWCGSPALRGEQFCYAHRQLRATGDEIKLPVLEDANSVQAGLMQVLNALLAKKISARTAGLMLYGLQVAAANLRRVNFEPFELRPR